LLRRIGAPIKPEHIDKIFSTLEWGPEDDASSIIFLSRGPLQSQLEFLKATVIRRDLCSTIKQRERFKRAVEDENDPAWVVARFVTPDPKELLDSIVSLAERFSKGDTPEEIAWARAWTNERIIQCLTRLYASLFAREPVCTEIGECVRFVVACLTAIGIRGQEGKEYSPLSVSDAIMNLKPEEKWGSISPNN
jgi:hypothetical protein